jgi:hypothetical protein
MGTIGGGRLVHEAGPIFANVDANISTRRLQNRDFEGEPVFYGHSGRQLGRGPLDSLRSRYGRMDHHAEFRPHLSVEEARPGIRRISMGFDIYS